MIAHSVSAQLTTQQVQMLSRSDSTLPFLRAVDSIRKELTIQDAYDTTEGGNLRSFARWSRFAEERICTNAPQGANRFSPANLALRNYLGNINTNCDYEGWKGDWQCLGPYINTFGGQNEQSGRVDAIWVHPTDTNFILLGSATGGLWKTTDGGHNWYNLTDASKTVISGTIGVNKIAVDPLDLDRIYIATGKHGMNKNTWGYSCGLLFSEDGGQTWEADANADDTIANQSDFWDESIGQLAYMPGSEKLFLVYKNKVFLKPTISSNWQDITPSIDSLTNITDLQFTKISPYEAVVKTSPINGTSKLWIYSGGSWSSILINLPGFNQVPGNENISISSQDNIYLNLTTDTSGKLLVEYSLNTGTTNVLRDNWFTDFQYIFVSPNHDSVFYGTLHTGFTADLSVSFNKGQTFSSNISTSNHADVRCVFIHTSVDTFNGRKDRIFVGSDGGITYKPAYQTQLRSIMGDGISISQVYGFSNTEVDEDILEGGSQDNGSYTWIKNRNPQWRSLEVDGDNYLSKFTRNGRTVYTQFNFPQTARIDFFDNPDSTAASMITNPPDGTVDSSDGRCDCGPNDTSGFIYLWHEHAQDTRNLYFDLEDNAFMGVYRIWRQHLGDVGWTQAFQNDPLMPQGADSTFDLRMVRDFIFSEKSPNIAYVAYKRPAGADSLGNIKTPKLFYTNVLTFDILQGQFTASWDDVTPEEAKYNRIMDLEVDPNDPERIWVALGEINWGMVSAHPDSMEERVMYSDDHGQTWEDISQGLPPLPVNKIIYNKNTYNELYAGTDVGVYRWDNGRSEWVCFSDSLPSCLVTDMEMNYCANKLRISTFGRGIWETKLYTEADQWNIPYTTEVEITSDTTWSRSRYLTGNIRIKNNAKLTIENTDSIQTIIGMPRNGTITIEPGADLIVDGAKITNGCDECMWYGIIVQGDKTVAQPYAGSVYHGVVTLKNGAVLEHARNAVNLFDAIEGDPDKTGGIINATESYFINNKRSIAFSDYPYDDKSIIKDCKFYIDSEYKGHKLEYPFGAHITMWLVNGVDITGCDFYNWDTNEQNMGKGNGIIAADAGFVVKPLCDVCSPSHFNGFRNGINISGGFENQAADLITGAAFDSNTVGVRAIVKNYVTVTNSTFDIGHGLSTIIDPKDESYLPQCPWNIGIYTNKAEHFWIEQNSFVGHENSEIGTLGTFTVSSGKNNNTIYKCNFEGLGYGSATARINGASPPDQTAPWTVPGLRFRCNSYEDNIDDIHIAAFNPSTHGVAVFQGRYSNNTFYSAENTFYHSTRHLVNEGLYIYYYGTASPGSPSQLFGGVFVDSFANYDDCSSKLGDDVMTTGNVNPFTLPVGEMKTKWDSLRLKRDTLLTNYLALLDNGSTSTLVSYIETYSGSKPALTATLIGYSPYLSKYAVIASFPQLDTGQFQSVVDANPDLLMDNEYYNTLISDLSPPLSDWYKDKLAADRGTITAAGKDVMEISTLSAEMSDLADQIITATRLDTTGTLLDTLAIWYRKMNSLSGEYLLAGHYFSIGDTSRAQEIIDSIAIKFTLGVDDTRDLEDYNEIFQVVKGIIAEGKTLDQADTGDVEAINEIFSTGTYETGIFAQKVLGPSTPEPEPPTPPLFGDCIQDGWVFERHAGTAQQALMPSINSLYSDNPYLKVSPNPARDIVHFTYNIPDKKGELTITITNTVGQIMQQFKVQNGKGVVDWSVINIPSGTYIYNMAENRRKIATGKVAIIK
jgi:hypothetical protein